MTIQVGIKLVCIDARDSDCLRADKIYTCFAVEPEFIGVDCCSEHHLHRHCGWFKRRFRPAVERKTSIEIFTKMLKPQGVNV